MPDSIKRSTFRKPEKLCSQTHIDRLFSEGKSLLSHHFRLIYIETDTPGQPLVKVLISVPKKNMKLAVDRNRMKRLIREAYRLSKHKLVESCTQYAIHYNIAFVFRGKLCISQQETQTAINELLDRLLLVHENHSE